MAAGSFTLYDNAKELLIGDHTAGVNIDTGGDTIGAHLLTSSYTPSAAHTAWSDISGSVTADGDYSAQTVAGQAVTRSGATVTFDANDVSFGTTVTITAKYIALVVHDTGTVGTPNNADKLIGYMDLNSGGGSVSSIASAFQINWNGSGIFTAA